MRSRVAGQAADLEQFESEFLGPGGLIVPVVGVGMLSGFTGTFPAVLAFSLLLAVLCLFSLARIATDRGSDRTGQ